MSVFKSIEVCPIGNPLPKHGPMLRDHRPVRTQEEYEKEINGFHIAYTWKEVLRMMEDTGNTSMWIVAKKS